MDRKTLLDKVRDAIYTELKSKYGSDTEMLSMGFEVKSITEDGVDLKIKGMVSTDILDSGNDVVQPTAFTSDVLTTYMKRPMLLFMHNMYTIPIGKVNHLNVLSNGLEATATIFGDSEDGKAIQRAIKEKVLNSFSFAYKIAKNGARIDKDTRIRTISTLEKLYEVSIVTIPMNDTAVFELAKSFHINTEETKPTTFTYLEKTMSNDLEKRLDDVDSTVQKVEASVKNGETTIKDLTTLLNQVKAKQTQFEEGSCSKADLLEFQDKITAHVSNAVNEFQEWKRATDIATKYIDVTDWQGVSKKESDWMLKDYGIDSPEKLQSDAFAAMNFVIHAPLDTAKMGETGHRIEMLRKLNDYLVVRQTMKCAQVPNYRVSRMDKKAYDAWVDGIDALTPGSGFKALATSNTGFGAELIPIHLSANFLTLLSLQSNVESLFESWQMPSADSRWPFGTSEPTVYIASEATTDNPSELESSNIGTSRVTFSTKALAARVNVSAEQIEDSVTSIISMIYDRLATASVKAMEDAILNGATGTHFDTGNSGLAANDVKRAFNGLRYQANTDSKTHDSSTFETTDLFSLKQKLGKSAINKAALAYITGPSAYFQIEAFNSARLVSSPMANVMQVPSIDNIGGVPLIVSDQFREDLNASGVYDAITKTYTAVLLVARNYWKVGVRRGVKLEAEYSGKNQQHTFIATQRKDFKKVSAPTVYTVAAGIKITA